MKTDLFKVIKDEDQYSKVIERIDELIILKKNGDVSDELKILSLLVSDYEAKNYKLNVPDPVDAILFRMDQMNLKQKDLVGCIGSKSKVSEVLSRKRMLTLNMIKNLHDFLGIPLEILLRSQKTDNYAENKKRFSIPIFETIGEKGFSYKGSEKVKTKPVTIRIPIDVIEIIKKKADEAGQPYQSLIKRILKQYSES